jgi:mono/diheme cytochrome c family protein
MQRVLRVLGYGVLALIGLLGIGVGVLYVLPPRSRPPPAETIAATPARLARGEYLVKHVVNCFGCHSDHLLTFGFPYKQGTEGEGGLAFDEGDGVPGRVVAKNITPDRETGIGSWTDGEILRAMREGVDRHGRALFPIMPWQGFRSLSDEDARSVVAYLKTLKPIHKVIPERKLAFPANIMIKGLPAPLTGPTPEPDANDSVAYGRYLAAVAHCTACHTPRDEHGQPILGREFAGGNRMVGPWGTVVTANITPEAHTYIGTATREEFIGRFKSFEALDPTELSAAPGQNTIMPWWAFSGMSEHDLGAIYDFLRTVPPVRNEVNSFPEAQYQAER